MTDLKSLARVPHALASRATHAALTDPENLFAEITLLAHCSLYTAKLRHIARETEIATGVHGLYDRFFDYGHRLSLFRVDRMCHSRMQWAWDTDPKLEGEVQDLLTAHATYSQYLGRYELVSQTTLLHYLVGWRARTRPQPLLSDVTHVRDIITATDRLVMLEHAHHLRYKRNEDDDWNDP